MAWELGLGTRCPLAQIDENPFSLLNSDPWGGDATLLRRGECWLGLSCTLSVWDSTLLGTRLEGRKCGF